MIVSEDIIPTTMEIAIPFAVVFFQNRSMRIAGRLAEAATAKAQPTRNDTFMPRNRMPRMMLNRVTMFALTMSATVRLGPSGIVLTAPAATRSAMAYASMIAPFLVDILPCSSWRWEGCSLLLPE